MPTAQKINIRPGVNTQQSPLLNESGWSYSNLVRFFQGMLQKLGGWLKLFGTPLSGVCRGIFSWQDLNKNQFVVAGTDQRLQLLNNSTLYDITPIVKTSNIATPFSTTSGSKTVKVTDVAHGAIAGQWINVITETYIDGVLILGAYQVTSVIDANNYNISISTTATSSVAGGGLTSLFSTTNTLTSVIVTINNHGLLPGQEYNVNVSTAVGGITFLGQYFVASVTDANNFVITATVATGTTTGRENTGNVRITYLLVPGDADSTPASGFGIGAYGSGQYGYGTFGVSYSDIRQWFFGNFGQLLLAMPTDGTLYLWNPTIGINTTNPATAVSGAPTAGTAMFVAMPQQQVVIVGAESGGTQQPLLIRWSDVGDYTSWTPAVTNQAGSFPLPSGSKIIGAMQGPQIGYIWTDIALWAMQYIGAPLVYGFNQIGAGCGLIGARAVGILNNTVYWMSPNNFFEAQGANVTPIPCTVWDKVFQNLNDIQREKITCAPNSQFNEVAWYYPSATGTGENDMYVKYNVAEGTWDYGALTRTAWMDKSIIINPIGVDGSGYIQQHEVSYDADGAAMDSWAETGWFKLSDGLLYLFLERLIPDFVLNSGATITLTIQTVDYQNDTPRSKTFTVNSSTEYLIVRMRGRFASIKVESLDLGSFWRLGEMLQIGSPAGRR